MSEKPDELALAKRSRLAARRITMIEQLKDEVDALRKENERLREALALAERLAAGRLAMVEQLAGEVEALRRERT